MTLRAPPSGGASECRVFVRRRDRNTEKMPHRGMHVGVYKCALRCVMEFCCQSFQAQAATFEPHSSNLGLKITQTFAAASWPWAPKPSTETRASAAAAATPAAGTGVAASGSSTAGAGDNAGARGRRSGSGSSIGSCGPARAGVGEVIAGGSGDRCGSDARDGDGAAATATTGSAAVDDVAGAGSGGGGGYSAFVGAFEGVISSMGSSGGARDGQTVVPSLVLDEDDDDGVGGGGDADIVADVCDLDGARPPAASWGGSGEDGGEVAAGGRAVSRRSVEALVCRMCGGTAEGPQNSTCTCSVRVRATSGFLRLSRRLRLCASCNCDEASSR